MIIWVIVFMNEAERRIPVQYAKKVVGRKMYGGQRHLPAHQGGYERRDAGDLRQRHPLYPPDDPGLRPTPRAASGRTSWDAFSQTGWLYVVLYFLLIIMFAYFYMSIQYNPLEMANNLRQNNGTVPGMRPGKPTADFIAKILSKVTLIGALFLAFVALIPIVFTNVTGWWVCPSAAPPSSLS